MGALFEGFHEDDRLDLYLACEQYWRRLFDEIVQIEQSFDWLEWGGDRWVDGLPCYTDMVFAAWSRERSRAVHIFQIPYGGSQAECGAYIQRRGRNPESTLCISLELTDETADRAMSLLRLWVPSAYSVDEIERRLGTQ